MTDAEALELVREWWRKGVPLTNDTPDVGFRPMLQPTRDGWSCWLCGLFETPNTFSGKTVAEAVERAKPAAERGLGRAD